MYFSPPWITWFNLEYTHPPIWLPVFIQRDSPGGTVGGGIPIRRSSVEIISSYLSKCSKIAEEHLPNWLLRWLVTLGFYFIFVWKRLIRGSGKPGKLREFNFAEFVSTLPGIRVARSPVFYGSSRISAPVSTLQPPRRTMTGRCNLPYLTGRLAELT